MDEAQREIDESKADRGSLVLGLIAAWVAIVVVAASPRKLLDLARRGRPRGEGSVAKKLGELPLIGKVLGEERKQEAEGEIEKV
jgi:hypothetical protein